MGKVATSPVPPPRSPPLKSGGKIRSGPQVGKVATPPLPSRGSPPLQSGGQNQKWPTSGQSGYATPAVSGFPTASERGAKSEVAHKWAKWLRHPCRLGVPHRFTAAGEIRSGQQVGKVATSPVPPPRSPPLKSGGKIRSGPQVGKVATPPLPSRGSPIASERGAKSEVTHLWAKWLCHACRLGDPHHFRAGGKIRSGPQVGKVATPPLPSRGSPTASERGAKSEVTHLWAKWLRHPCRLGDPHRFTAGGKSEVAHKWAKWLRQPCHLGDPHRFRAGGKSEVAHLWAKWLRHPCRLGDPHRFRAGGKIRSGPQVGKVATSPLHSRGSPPLKSGGQNQKWPTCGQSGYVTAAVSGIPTA